MLVRDPRWVRSTVDLRAAVVQRDRGLCRYCGRVPAVIEIDHVWPVSLGGRTTLTNCVAACPACNRAKGSRTDWQPIALADLPAVAEPAVPLHTRARRHRTVAQRRRIRDAARQPIAAIDSMTMSQNLA